MDQKELFNLKHRIDSIGRKKISVISGISYARLTQFLNGFIELSKEDIGFIKKAMGEE